MTADCPKAGMVGPFWVVEEAGKAAIIALAVPLDQAAPYGDMLTVEAGHLQHWSWLGRRGAAALRAAGLPTAPVWSEYEEWPRGRVLYDGVGRQFVIRADQQLRQPGFLRLVRKHFCIGTEALTVLADDHYRSVRLVSLPSGP